MKYAVIIILIIPLIVIAQSGRVKVTGEYTYTYGDNESLLEAKSLCYTMAIRNAIESLTVFVQSTATVDNYQLRNDLVQTIASGYIDDLRVDEENVVGRTVYYKITGYVVQSAVKNIIQNRVRLHKNEEAPGIQENECLKILRIKEKANSQIIVLYKALKEISTVSSRPQEKICIDYYDYEGLPLSGDKKEAEWQLIKGEIRKVEFTKPQNAKSYRVWLLK